ncbi:hypothetical protein AB6A40_011372 [Gnathostoma spinigerum]|uniref:Uncharacterized protein n=1 Tax=Gnathostoma spinigerum TaxID=75299 RepID=A0ABD6EY30_9BILA
MMPLHRLLQCRVRSAIIITLSSRSLAVHFVLYPVPSPSECPEATTSVYPSSTLNYSHIQQQMTVDSKRRGDMCSAPANSGVVRRGPSSRRRRLTSAPIDTAHSSPFHAHNPESKSSSSIVDNENTTMTTIITTTTTTTTVSSATTTANLTANTARSLRRTSAAMLLSFAAPTASASNEAATAVGRGKNSSTSLADKPVPLFKRVQYDILLSQRLCVVVSDMSCY